MAFNIVFDPPIYHKNMNTDRNMKALVLALSQNRPKYYWKGFTRRITPEYLSAGGLEMLVHIPGELDGVARVFEIRAPKSYKFYFKCEGDKLRVFFNTDVDDNDVGSTFSLTRDQALALRKYMLSSDVDAKECDIATSIKAIDEYLESK